MKSARAKNFFREIKNNKGRFFSIFFIVLLGTAFFAGIRSSSSDMKYLADQYYRSQNLMDLRVLSTLGITDEDIEDLQNSPDVELAEGGHTADMLVERDQELKVVKVISSTEKINLPFLMEGELPEAENECIADFALVKELGYKIGDTVELRSGTSDDIEDTLNTTEFTITGIGSLPYYIDLTRGSSDIGDGRVEGFIIVSPEVFEQEVFTEGYLKVKGTEGLYAFDEAYKKTVEKSEDNIKAVLEDCADRRYEEVTSEAWEEIDEHKQEIADAEQELADAKTDLEEGEEELKDAKTELEDAEKELSDAEKELKDAKTEIDDGKQKIADAEEEIRNSEQELADGWEQYYSGKNELESGREQLGSAWQQYYDGQKEIAANEETLKDGRAQLDAGYAEYYANEEAFQAQKAEYEAGEAQYASLLELLKLDPENVELQAQAAALRAQLDAVAPVIAQGEQQLAAAKQTLDEKNAELTAGEQQLEQAKATAAAAYETLAAKQAEFDASEQQLAAAYQELADAQEKLNEGKAELEEKKQELADGEKEYEDGLAEYKDGLAEYEDGAAEYEDGLKEWQDGKQEYDDSYQDAMEEIEDGKNKIADAEEELEDLEYPDTYVLSREKVACLVSFDGDADRIDRLSDVFPVIFFLVAALVSLTAMTRMVEEQRLEIGTLKGLGAGNAAVASKYVSYAALATLSGGVIGVFVGQRIIPAVVIDAYHSLYNGIPTGEYPFNVFWAVIAVAIAAACTILATVFACGRALADMPAILMRPEAPKSGKRVIFEYFTGFWKRLIFSKKATIRNLFRYKKRFFMTIIGIGGCMALMLVGFGIQDSITGIAKLQYVEIFSQDATITLNTQASEQERQELIDTVSAYEGITDVEEVVITPITMTVNDIDRSGYIYVPQAAETADEYVRLQDRSGNSCAFPEKGSLITEKAADKLGVGKGDTVEVKLSDDSEPAEAVVNEVVQNYVYHYLYVSPETYREMFDEEPEYNKLLIKYENAGDRSWEKKLGETLIAFEACSAVEFVTDLKDQIDDMLDSLNMVMWVLILCSAFLAFVVLYNLNSINMTERKRELATLKVLGFHDSEVAMYIYRENIILTLIGIVAGIFLGIIMHRFLITTVEVDLMMFGRKINLLSFVICAALTALFSLMVNLIMFWHFRKIDMIESLKSVE